MIENRKYTCIVCDPPYSFDDKLQHSDVARGADANYSTMSIADIKQLPIKDIADPEGAILALWVPSSLLQDGLDIMKSYGFSHRQTYIWVKTKKEPFKQPYDKSYKILKNIKEWSLDICLDVVKQAFNNLSLQDELSFGMGRLMRQCHEICLIGINNTKIYKKLKNRSQRSVSFAPNLRHSAKPEFLQNSLDLMFPDPNNLKIEIFARRQRPGWLCIGNQSGHPISNGKDIRVILDNLFKLKNNA